MGVKRDLLQNELRAYAREGVAVTPHDSNNLAKEDALIYVGVGGDVKLKLENDSELVFKNVPAGMFMPVLAKRVFATGTTATDILALY
jgi:hypothetical protein